MTDEADEWLMRPVLEGLIRYESLLGTELTLLDIAMMHDALDCRAENQSRAHHAPQAENRNR